MRRFFRKITHWELWPFNFIYAPLSFVWLYYTIKANAFWFFSPVNPQLEFSGFEGESKREMYGLIPQQYYPKTIYVNADHDFELVKEQLDKQGIYFPLVAKPDRGMQGILFRKIDNEQQLKAYHDNIPVEYVIQDFVDLPMEFSVFHIRYPQEKKGRVTGFILKEYLTIMGDGQSTLLLLIKNHPRACHREQEMRHKHADNLEKILPAGEHYYLSYAGNHNRGARFINLHREIDNALCEVFDNISNNCGSFHFGRYDLKCTSIEDLKQGKNISILEFNGAGAEPNHIYDCGMGYLDALKEVAKHWNDLYEIGRINNKNGVPYWSFDRGRKYLNSAKKFFNTLRKYDSDY